MDPGLPPAHHATPEHKERAHLETMRVTARTAREFHQDKVAEHLEEMAQKELDRLNKEYHRDGTAWMGKLDFVFPDGHVEVLPEGRYDRGEHLGLSMRMQARHAAAVTRAGYP